MKTITKYLESTMTPNQIGRELHKPFENSNIPHIEIILSYQNKPQSFVRVGLTPNYILRLLGESETEYKENLRWFLNTEDTVGLCKISNCVYRNNIEFNLPQWYNDCNGKVFFDDTEDNFKLQIV